jgi:hypothetical protein
VVDGLFREWWTDLNVRGASMRLAVVVDRG